MEDHRKLIVDAEDRKEKLPMFMAVVMVHSAVYEDMPAEDICSALGMSENYAHLVRTLLKVEGCLARLVGPTTSVVKEAITGGRK